MSVTVEQLLKLPSLSRAKVIGGHRGLSKVVSSISVLESTDPGVLVDEVFPQGEFFGSEIVITGFLNSVDNVPLQLANIRRLAEGGEVGLIVFYVGVYLPRIDPRLIALANELDFVLIVMPEGEATLRYGEVIIDVMECIYRDRAQSSSVVLDVLAGISALPKHLQTVNTALKILSDRISASVLLCDASFHVLNLVAWPRGIESEVSGGFQAMRQFPPSGESAQFPFVLDSRIYSMNLGVDGGQKMELLLVKAGLPFDAATLGQIIDATRICINIWGRRHGEIAIHELVRAILQDEPLKMHRLAEIFHVDVASLHAADLPGNAPDPAGGGAAERRGDGDGGGGAAGRGILPLLGPSKHRRCTQGLSRLSGKPLRRHEHLSTEADLYLGRHQLLQKLPPGHSGRGGGA